MKRLLLLTIALFPPALLAHPILPHVVQIRLGEEYGTGTVIEVKKQLRILTCAHVVAGAIKPRDIVYVDKDGKEVTKQDTSFLQVDIATKRGKQTIRQKASVIWYDEKHDLALLAPDDTSLLIPARFTNAPVSPGVTCWYCGYGGGLLFNLQKAVVNQVRDDTIVVNGGGWYGHSGSAVFVRDQNGRWGIVGVLNQLHDPKNPKSPLLAIPNKTIKTFLEHAP